MFSKLFKTKKEVKTVKIEKLNTVKLKEVVGGITGEPMRGVDITIEADTGDNHIIE